MSCYIFQSYPHDHEKWLWAFIILNSVQAELNLLMKQTEAHQDADAVFFFSPHYYYRPQNLQARDRSHNIRLKKIVFLQQNLSSSIIRPHHWGSRRCCFALDDDCFSIFHRPWFFTARSKCSKRNIRALMTDCWCFNYFLCNVAHAMIFPFTFAD